MFILIPNADSPPFLQKTEDFFEVPERYHATPHRNRCAHESQGIPFGPWSRQRSEAGKEGSEVDSGLDIELLAKPISVRLNISTGDVKKRRDLSGG